MASSAYQAEGWKVDHIADEEPSINMFNVMPDNWRGQIIKLAKKDTDAQPGDDMWKSLLALPPELVEPACVKPQWISSAAPAKVVTAQSIAMPNSSVESQLRAIPIQIKDQQAINARIMEMLVKFAPVEANQHGVKSWRFNPRPLIMALSI